MKEVTTMDVLQKIEDDLMMSICNVLSDAAINQVNLEKIREGIRTILIKHLPFLRLNEDHLLILRLLSKKKNTSDIARVMNKPIRTIGYYKSQICMLLETASIEEALSLFVDYTEKTKEA